MKPRIQYLVAALPLAAAVPATLPVSLSPGPGLPSLQQLGITIQDLLDNDYTPNSTDTQLAPRDSSAQQFFPKCFKSNQSQMGPVKLCQNYLSKLGDQECLATRDEPWNYMCNATMKGVTAFVRAAPNTGLSEASCPCGSVAKGMNWILELCVTSRCAGDDCTVGGTNSAYGNGDVVLEIVGDASIVSSPS